MSAVRVLVGTHKGAFIITADGGNSWNAIVHALALRPLLDAPEESYPMLLRTIRDRATQARRPFVRFFAGEEVLSLTSPDAPLPEEVVSGSEPFLVVGALAGG